jgi:hypothetical protein
MPRKPKADVDETISGYFRKVFAENPKLLETRSNQELLQRWLRDHPGETEVPGRVKVGLSNIKSVLRKQRKKRGGKKPAATATSAADGPAAPRPAARGLEQLEEGIDDCLTLAKNLDREGLASVITLLRRARNEVVWKLGE